MRVVVKAPGREPEVRVLHDRNVLTQLQGIVDGWVELAWTIPQFFGDGRLVVYCNEEGKLAELPFNVCRPTDGEPILGTIVAVKGDASGAEDLDMTEDEADKARVTLLLYAQATQAHQ